MLQKAITVPKSRESFIMSRLMLYSEIENFRDANVRENMSARNLHYLLGGKFAVHQFMLTGKLEFANNQMMAEFKNMMNGKYVHNENFDEDYVNVVQKHANIDFTDHKYFQGSSLSKKEKIGAAFGYMNWITDSCILDKEMNQPFYRGAKFVDKLVMGKLSADLKMIKK